jgi:hypothetical protein
MQHNASERETRASRAQNEEEHSERHLGQIEHKPVVELVLFDKEGKVVQGHGKRAARNVRVQERRLVNRRSAVPLRVREREGERGRMGRT